VGRHLAVAGVRDGMTPSLRKLFHFRRPAFAKIWNFFGRRDRGAFEERDIFQFALMA
jgi:hypothetical protein